MEFRILGPLEVRDGGRVVAVRGPRQRALLALLLLHANETIPGERLVEELWQGAAPASGTTALRVRVSQLRRTLGVDLIATNPRGYALEVEPERIDARRFERLLERGRRLRADGAAAEAATTLQAALALWRGPALTDLAYEPWAGPEIGRLEELRLIALEERIEADLELGAAEEVVGEIEALVAEHPFRERLRGQLMLALYRSGRQADALDTYRAARTAFVEELGLEPGPALQQLEGAILRQEEWLNVRVAPRSSSIEERKVVTVLAAGFDPGEADLERTQALLERARVVANDEVEAAGGRLEGRLGAMLVATFGAPLAQEDHAERALDAALAVRRRIEETFEHVLGVRIGVETGEALVGEVTTGAAVARVMELEQGAARGEILAGERTVAATRATFEFSAERKLGWSLGRKWARRAPARRRTPFVGREHELDVLRAAYRSAVERGCAGLVAIVGEAGIGKSRLVTELCDRLAHEHDTPLLFSGRCLPTGRATVYSPFADILRQHLGLRETAAPDAALEPLGARRILALTLGLDVAPQLHPLNARDQLQEAWVDLLEELATTRPAVLAIEDVHWAEEPLFDLLARVGAQVRAPLLVVSTARPEARPPGDLIRLEPLSDEQVEEILGNIDEDARRFVIGRAEGNPFFAEELLAIAHETPAPTPDSVQAVLAARIDRLPPAEKAALQAAAVLGRQFSSGALRQLLDAPRPDFALLEERELLRRCETSSLRGDSEFVFKHGLTREVAYASVPKPRRARLHARAADWLEHAVEAPEPYASVLAHHYYEAARPDDADLAWDDGEDLARLREKALTWLRIGATRAISRYELDQALAQLQNALTIAPSDDVRCELWRLLGRAHALRYDGEAFWAALEHAIEHAADDYTRGELYAELAFETHNRAGMWPHRPSEELVDRWIEQALRLAEPGGAALARALVASAFSDPSNAGVPAEQAVAIAERLNDPALLAAAWDAQRVAALGAADWEQELRWAERRLELRDAISDPDLRADIFATVVPVYLRRGRLEDALSAAEDNDKVTAPMTPHHRVHGVAVQLEAREASGRWEEILMLESRAEQTIAANARTPCVRNARALLVCAAARAYAGDLAGARSLEERAEVVALQGFGHVLDTPRIRVALARSDLDRVAELVASAPIGARDHVVGRTFGLITLATRLDALAALRDRGRLEQEAPPLLAAGAYLEPFALRALGVVREDDELLRAAVARFVSLGLHWHAAQTPFAAKEASSQALERRPSGR